MVIIFLLTISILGLDLHTNQQNFKKFRKTLIEWKLCARHVSREDGYRRDIAEIKRNNLCYRLDGIGSKQGK